MLDHILFLSFPNFSGVTVLSSPIDYKLQEGKLKSHPLSLIFCCFLASSALCIQHPLAPNISEALWVHLQCPSTFPPCGLQPALSTRGFVLLQGFPHHLHEPFPQALLPLQWALSPPLTPSRLPSLEVVMSTDHHLTVLGPLSPPPCAPMSQESF